MESDLTDLVQSFIAIGSRPTWSEWVMWSDEMRDAAFDAIYQMQNLHNVAAQVKPELTDEEKIRIADELSAVDGGKAAREMRMEINRKALCGDAK